jgi:hypothetical protein
MTAPFSGGCACGSIRYTCSRAPVATLNCHCLIIPAHERQGFQRIVDTHSGATRTRLWPDRGRFAE